jgi:hypothetical protein
MIQVVTGYIELRFCSIGDSVADPDPVLFYPLDLGWIISGSQVPDLGSFWLWLRICSWNYKKQEKSKFAFHFSCRIRDQRWKNAWIRIRDEKMFGSGILDKTSRIRNTGTNKDHFLTWPVSWWSWPLSQDENPASKQYRVQLYFFLKGTVSRNGDRDEHMEQF